MPPRFNFLQTCTAPHAVTRSPLAPLLALFAQPLSHQQRFASVLSSLSDNPGAYQNRHRVGRGPSSGRGKTSGRGHKGQRQHGKVPAGFEGGQTPLHIVKGERGFSNQFAENFSPLNLDRIQSWIDQGRLDPSKPITVKELSASRCLHGVKDGVKLLARNAGQLRTPINIVVSRASAKAIAAIEGAGGSVTSRYYSPVSIKRVLAGLSDPIVSTNMAPDSPIVALRQQQEEADHAAVPRYRYRLPDPAGRKDLEYYRDPAKRGYLSYMVPPGKGPSLFERKTARRTGRVSPQQTKEKVENRIW